MKNERNKVSLRAIARRAGVSLATTSYALQNQPGPSLETRKLILRVAKELGYAPDARMGSWMAKVRDAKSKDLLPIAWLNSSWEEDTWRRYRFHTPYVEGARERAQEFGYKLEEIWFHEKGMTMRRLSKMLYQRGIEGVIIPFPAKHVRFNWDHLAGVTIGEALLAPKLHRVSSDINFNLKLALKHLKRLGYRRIGICLGQAVDTVSYYSIRDSSHWLFSTASNKDRIPPLIHTPYWRRRKGDKEKEMVAWLRRFKPESLNRHDKPVEEWAEAAGFGERDKEKEVIAWLKRYKPEVIVGHDNHLEQWAEAAGFRVPEDLCIVNTAVDDDVLDWAGIHSQRREIGATAVEWLVSLMRNHQYGVPKTPLNILIRGIWQTGRTLGMPPKAPRTADRIGQSAPN